MRKTWTNPIYLTQILTGAVAIGAIFGDGLVTRLRLYLAAIAVLSTIASLFVASRTEAESQRNRMYLETLLRSMELPYFIIKKLSQTIIALARQHGWLYQQQENFQQQTVYRFQQAKGAADGLFVLSEADFKSLWIMEERERTQQLEARLFGTRTQRSNEAGSPEDQEDEHLQEVVRQAVSEIVDGPHWIRMEVQPPATWVFGFARKQDSSPQPFLTLTPQRRAELLQMPPIRRYAVLTAEVKAGCSALPH